jgi:hypothetical protein
VLKPIFDPSDSSVDTLFKGPIMIEIKKFLASWVVVGIPTRCGPPAAFFQRDFQNKYETSHLLIFTQFAYTLFYMWQSKNS